MEMTEDPVIPTTELVRNSKNGTMIDATHLTLLASKSNLVSPKLPFHGVSSSLKDRSGPRPPFARNHSNSHTMESPSGPDSDAMDFVPSISTIVQVRIPPPPRFPPLPYSSSKTGLVYDERMRFHSGLVHGPNDPPEKVHEEQCWWIHTRSATSAEICLIHTPQHYSFIESLQRTYAEH
jgi:histone deacetylase 6